MAVGGKLATSLVEIGPPPIASNKQSKLCYFTKPLTWSTQSSSAVTTICLAPSLFNNSACYFLLTMFKRGTPLEIQSLLSCLPKADAAAVWMIPPFKLLSLNV